MKQGIAVRLAEFILANIEPILADWEEFARSIWPPSAAAAAVTPRELRDHAEAILRATAQDMGQAQSERQRKSKSRGQSNHRRDGSDLSKASESHGAGRVTSGLQMAAMVSEYRALRASVLRLWRESRPKPDRRDLDDMTRFNESIDQSMAYAVGSFLGVVQRERDALFAQEHAARCEAEAANKAKDQFLAILSHELRTPLSPVLLAVGALLARPDVSQGDRPMLEMIRRNIELEARLIEDLLDVTRISRNKMELRIEMVDMHEALRDVLDMCAQEARDKGLKMSSELRARQSLVRGDPARLRQVIWNLLKNAIKFTASGGEVVVRTSNPATDRLALSVADTGIGISTSETDRLFIPFEQEARDRQHFGGLGLGLTISRALVEAHHGTISASSEGKGRGATFTVEMPVAVGATEASPARPDQKHPAQRAPSPAQQRKLRILVVEDHGDTVGILGKLLEGEGHEVRVATTVQDGLRLSGEGELDLIISDLGLPDGSGHELMKNLRLSHPVPAIALSGYGSEADIRKSLESGFNKHIIKPVNFDRLLRAIDEVTR